ncbi:MAG: MFS transporter [Dysgonamonadaceae bacterium]|jgi:ACS family hexuronate transporter-like MFS transporter|nr:MFS transporter [Dysgonamonadaceae bacterium]
MNCTDFFKDADRRKWFITGTIFLAIICNYVDRQLLSILKPDIKSYFDIGDEGYAFIVNIFLMCYAVMYPISGILVDRFGPKRVMVAGIAAWSLACIGGGLSTNVIQFTICRGILGLAEPTIFAGQIVVVTLWFTRRQRATANSLCTAGGSIGTVIAPILIAWLSTVFASWQEVFLIAGGAGLAIAVVWMFVYVHPPKEILELTLPQGQAEEGDSGKAFTWFQLWKTRSLWGVLLIRFISDPVWYFCCFWLPGYLQEDSGLTLMQVGYVGWIPFLVGAIGGVSTSAWSDGMVRRGCPSLIARKRVLTCVALFAPLCMFTPFFNGLPGYWNVFAIIVSYSIIAVMCLSWLYTICVVIAESFPVKNVASVTGITAGCGAVGGAIFNYYVGQLLGTMGNTLFVIMGLMHLTAIVILWRMTRPESVK